MFQSLQSYNYRVYLSTRGFSLIGVAMQRIAFLWLVYSMSESATWVAFAAVTRQLAQVILSPWAGLLADMLDRKKIIVITQWIALFTNLIMGYLIFQGNHLLWMLILSEWMLGLVNGMEQPVRQSFVYDLTENKNHLGNAIALHSSTINFSQVAGPLLAGIFIATYGEWFCYLVNTGMLLVFIAGLWFVKPVSQSNTRKMIRKEIIPELVSGFQYAQKQINVRYILWATVIASAFGFSFTVLLPVVAGEMFQGEAETLGYMHTAVAIGSLLGTFVLAVKKGVSGWQDLMFLGGVLFGVSIVLLFFVNTLYVALAVLLLIGFMKAVTFNGGKTALQYVTSDAYQGRVSGLYFMYMMGAITLGGFMIGVAADLMGYMQAIVLFAVINIVLCLLLWIQSSGKRKIIVYLKLNKFYK